MKAQLIITNKVVPSLDITNKLFLLCQNANYGCSLIRCNFYKFEPDQFESYRKLNKKLKKRLKHKMFWIDDED